MYPTKRISALLCLVLIILYGCSTDMENAPANLDLGQQEEEQAQDPKNPVSVEEIAIFPPDHPLNLDISNHSVDQNSDAILNNIGLDVGLFADFGSGTYQGSPIGIPFVAVGGDQPKVGVSFRANDYDGNYGDESDQGPFPVPLDAVVEGNGEGDSHVITVDVDNGMLYELYNAEQAGGGWEASSAALFDLKITAFRPEGWTSADAAGLPIFPLLVRYSEIEKGEIDHPIRFTLQRDRIYEGYVHPARHLVSGATGDHLLPFGARLRLKADFDISSFSATNQAILRALKKYGLILADVGSNMFLSGNPDDHWNNDDLKVLGNVRVSNFEVLTLGDIKTN